jgi:uncharacterized MAPEG superfamily protein
MEYVALVSGLALLEYFAFGLLVGKARGTYGVKAPAITGHEIFERYFRVQQNTLELLILMLPSMWLFATYVSPGWAAALGLVYCVGRLVYLRSYVADPSSRSAGFGLSALPTLILLIGAMIGAGSTLL